MFLFSFFKYSKVLKLGFLILLIVPNVGHVFAQLGETKPSVQWQNKKLKSTTMHTVIKNLEGNLVFVGTADKKSRDISFVIADTAGHILKDTIIVGGDKSDEANAVCNTRDGGYLIAGYTRSPKLHYIGESDGWIVKTDFNGKPLWEALIGTTGEDVFTSVTEDGKGNFYLTGYSNNALWVVKLSVKGEKLWEKRLVGMARRGRSIAYSQRTGLAVVGGFETEGRSENLFITGFDGQGNLVFDKKYPNAAAEKLLEMPNGNWLIAGRQYSRKTYQDMLMLQTDSVGTMLKSHTFGGSWDDGAEGFAFDPISGTVCLAGFTYSHVRNAHKSQLWLVKTDLNGNELWQKRAYFGGKENDEAQDLLLSAEGKLFALGSTGIGGKPWLISFGTIIDYKDAKNINGLSIEQGAVSAVDTTKTVFEQTDRGFYEFTLTNNSTLPISPLVATVLPTTKTAQGLWVLPKIDIGQMLAGESRRITIPLSIGDTVTTDTSYFEVKFFVKNIEIGNPLAFNVVTKAAQRAQLKILESSFLTDTDFDSELNGMSPKSKKLTLNLTIKNKGTVKAEQTKAHFICPANIKTKTPQTVDVGDLNRDSSQIVSFEFEPGATYADSVVQIRVSITEKTGQGDTYEDMFVRLQKENFVFSSGKKAYVFDIDKEKETEKEEDKGKSYLNMMWQLPNPAKESSTEFPIYTPDMTLQVGIQADKPLVDSNIQVYLNERLFQGAKAKVARIGCIEKKENKYDCVFEKNILLESGINTIEVKARNGNVTESVQKITVNCQVEKPNLYVLSIGVPHSDLQYSTKDAQDFAQLWQSQEKKFFEHVTVKTLNTQEATYHYAIKDVIDTLRNAFNKSDILKKDYLIIYISSHGFLDTRLDTSFCIEPSDYSQTLSRTWINFELDVLKSLLFLNCQKLFFIDACRSGQAMELSTKLTKSLESRTDNFRYILSSDANEYSYEDKVWQNSAFTKAIMEAIGNEKVDMQEGLGIANANHDNTLTLEELMLFLRKRVSFMVTKQKGQRQTPCIYPKSSEKVKNNLEICKF
jgi:Caspase domain